jgi:predicted DCC family thiol-disulfide oxidoreductase YuxK
MTKVLYNNNCPVCSLEINHYKKYSEKEDIQIIYEDLNKTNLEKWSLSKDESMKRLHVIKNNTLYSGVDAFIVLWDEMPKYKKLSNCVSHKLVYKPACIVYNYILAPLLYNWNKWVSGKNKN